MTGKKTVAVAWMLSFCLLSVSLSAHARVKGTDIRGKLRWGMTPEEVRKAVPDTAFRETERGLAAEFSIFDEEGTLHCEFTDNRLARVRVVFKGVNRDNYTQRFVKLENALKLRYGEAKRQIRKAPERPEIKESVEGKGGGYYISVWVSKESEAVLSLLSEGDLFGLTLELSHLVAVEGNEEILKPESPGKRPSGT
jgi:hypothetical protein